MTGVADPLPMGQHAGPDRGSPRETPAGRLAAPPKAAARAEDQRLVARVTRLLREARGLRDHTRHVRASVSDGVVTLFGTVDSRAAVSEIVGAVRTLAGAGRVETRLVARGPRGIV